MINLPSERKCEPENEDKLEGIVEWEPVNGGYKTLENGEEGKYNPVLSKVSYKRPGKRRVDPLTYGEPLSIIRSSNTEQSLERVVSGNHESSKVGKKLSPDVEEDKEEVGCSETEDCIRLRHGGLLLEVVDNRILGKLRKYC